MTVHEERRKTPTNFMLIVSLLFLLYVGLWYLLGDDTRFDELPYPYLRKGLGFFPHDWQMRAAGLLLLVLGLLGLYAWYERRRVFCERVLFVAMLWFVYLTGVGLYTIFYDGPPISAGWAAFTAASYYTLARRVVLVQ